ncbi:pectinesterase family protein [Brevundimonas subvibrioides]|uniref:Pectinesterase n=1 Tax=Brevundimonas subvibrioides (strain ATCC 15264 / DSM 4735 / LMG 14903 / NBRC 16000 / CB 81) TaxID=633149 RepID=D9QM39_BRESC|nr:pectinesterase family protein [Brevundimonas subvibrioides]ADL01965.1 Pectinesterase [Brevundimonas subvibrioides ATCC 15264]
MPWIDLSEARRRLAPAIWLACLVLAMSAPPARAEGRPQAVLPTLFPADGATGVNPDTRLVLTFDRPPAIGAAGQIRILDAADGRLVDTLDLALPVSPVPTGRATNPDGTTRPPTPPQPAGPDNPGFQATQIGGAWFHFFPVIVHGNTATLYPHHGALTYGRTYRVEIDPGVLTVGDDDTGRSWRFTTRAGPPAADTARVVVAADGSGDFNTVQGAIDFVPAAPVEPVTIFIRNGRYEEIVYLNGKSNLILRGESRDGVVVGYANNSAFNRIRPAFTVTASRDIQLSSFTINNYFFGQAEALLMRGERNIIDRMTLNGSGDALTTHGTLYMVDSLLTGDGDTILGYAALYCLRCELRSAGPFSWTRTPQGSHGNVFVDSTFIHVDRPLPWEITPADVPGRSGPGVFARLPRNGPTSSQINFPFAEMVLIDTRTDGIPPEGWGPVEPEPAFGWSNIRLWEFNTMDLDGRPVDTSRRHPAARVLTLPRDAAILDDYRRPAFVLGGWEPVVR